MFKLSLLFLITIVITPRMFSGDMLLYLEAQGVAGYSFTHEETRYYSLMPFDVMQKPSFGFDLIKRFSSDHGDTATVYLQGRLSVNETDGIVEIEPQLYNAYVKYKLGGAYLWIGHNKPAYGISNVIDNHGELMNNPAMSGFGYDRDWGLGYLHDFQNGSIALSLTAGSGMPFIIHENYLMSGRLSYGVLNSDGYSAGISGAYGAVIDTMGNHVFSDEPIRYSLASADISYLFTSIENRAELIWLRKDSVDMIGLFYRLTVSFLEENRLRADLQSMITKVEENAVQTRYEAGLSYQATESLWIRSQYAYDEAMNDSVLTMQLYWYTGL